tara:strand:+ start:606 stop:1922 length:1317 start_codon:yes stop_codon:yes gene_type:complete
MSKTYLENDLGVSALPSIDKGHKMHPVSKGSSLYLKQTPNSMRFVWRKKGKDIAVGEWANNTLEMLFLIKKANEWMKENPTSDPKSFFNQEQTEEKTFHGAWQEYWEWYTDDVKETTWDDRKNKWKVIFDHFGKNTPLKDFEIANGGKRKIYNFQKKSCFDRQKYSQGKRYRSVMKSFFKYCIQLEWMDSNPAEFAHPDESKIETIRYNRPKRNQHIKWSEVTQLMKSIKKKFGKYNITDLAVKLHLMMSIRSSVIAELRFEWYDPENDNWEIPYTCKGMKKRKGHYYDDDVFIIPSTPEINQIVNHLQSMHRLGWYGFVFPSQVKDKFHNAGICIDGINNRLKQISCGEQTAHGWRDVFVEATQTAGFKKYIIDRCLGHTSHGHSSWTPYDEGEFVEERRKLMKWWTKELVNKGLVIDGKGIESGRLTHERIEPSWV